MSEPIMSRHATAQRARGARDVGSSGPPGAPARSSLNGALAASRAATRGEGAVRSRARCRRGHRGLGAIAIGVVSLALLGACRGAGDRAPAPSATAPLAAATAAAGDSPHKPFGIDIIDSHVHIVPLMPPLAMSLEVFDRVGITRFCAKSAGTYGDPRFEATVAMKRVLGDRFEFFANVDWEGIDRPDFAARESARIRGAARQGAKGVKIFKALGLSVRTADGKLLPVDDPRLDPIFATVGELGLIMALHIGDPVAFFEPVTPDNERYDELKIAESWSFHGKDYPSHAELMAQQERLIARHPNTAFLLIHVGGHPENLDAVDALLDAHPNVWIDTSARVPEIGRQPPDKVRAFFIKHQNRILFGSDFIATPGGMQLGSVSETEPTVADAVVFFQRHWQYFETNDRDIDHPTPIQGRWKVSAIGLPESVLRKLYHDNAMELIFRPSIPLQERLALRAARS